MNDDGWQCCFCAKAVEPRDGARIVIYPTPELDELQEVRAHRSCLAERLHPSVALHPAFDEAMDSEES